MNETEPRSQRGLGAVLVLVGIFILVVRQFNLDFGVYVTLLVGVVFLGLRFLGGQEWAIYPGAFTTAAGIPVALAASGRVDMAFWWPLFVLGPGLAFFLIAATSSQDRWALIPGSIISGVGVVFFAANSGMLPWNYLNVAQRWWPVLLVVAGVVILLRGREVN